MPLKDDELNAHGEWLIDYAVEHDLDGNDFIIVCAKTIMGIMVGNSSADLETNARMTEQEYAGVVMDLHRLVSLSIAAINDEVVPLKVLRARQAERSQFPQRAETCH